MLMCMKFSRSRRFRQSQIYFEVTTIQLTMTNNTFYHNSYANVYEIFKIRKAWEVSDLLRVCYNTVYYDKEYNLP